MEAPTLASVADHFLQFHAEFAPTFGRKQWRERSRDYLRGLLTLTGERGNAENLAEMTDASERVLQRFLTEAHWDDQAVLQRLQAYLAPRLTHPEAVWVVDETSFPKQGKKSVGVSHQYCGALSKVANCQIGVFLAHVGPRGRALVDKRLWLPEGWATDGPRCDAAQVPEAPRAAPSKTDLALAMLQQAQAWGHLQAVWVTGDDIYGQCPTFREGVAAAGWQYVLEIPGSTPVWPAEPTWETPPRKRFGPPPQPRPVVSERQEARERATALPPTAWQALTVGDGAQGPRTYLFAFERVRESRHGRPGATVWLIHKLNLDGTEPRTFFSNASADTPVAELARVAMSRWPIETEFQSGKGQVALDEYEVRSWPGWHHHQTMCLLAAAFLLTLQQEWGKKGAAAHAPAGPPAGLRAVTAQALGRSRLVGVAAADAGAQ
jgi:SRSO17 transposase